MNEIGVLLLLRDDQQQQRFKAALGRAGCVILGADSTPQATCELIVADQLDLSALPEPLRAAQLRGEIGLIQIGTICGGDVVLPGDCSSRELALACRLLAEIVRLRRAARRQQQAKRTWQRLAHRDPLTDLPNRRAWNRELRSRLALFTKESRLALVLLDIDEFKPLNDDLGHSAGDQALRAIADAFRSSLRRGDLPARLGGDEFGVLLADIDPTCVAAVANRIRCAAADAASTAVRRRVSLSAGYTLVTSGIASEALESADAALRRAKHEGRDTTCGERLATCG